jgi:heavy metal sensor kinase
MAVIIFAFSGILYASLRASMLKAIDDALLNGLRKVRREMVENRGEPLQKFVDDELEDLQNLGVAHIQVMAVPLDSTAAPQVVASSARLAGRTLPVPSLPKSARAGFASAYGAFAGGVRVAALPVTGHGRTRTIVVVAAPLTGVTHVLRQLMLMLAVTVPVLLVLLTIWGYLFVRRAFAPVRRIVGATKRITAADLSLRLPPAGGSDELAELVATVNDMIGRIETSFVRMEQFSSDAAHELRTPVAALRGEIEVALRKERNAEEYRRALERVLTVANGMEPLVGDLLLLSRLDSRAEDLAGQDVQLDEIVLEAHEETYRQAEATHVSLALGPLAPVAIKGNPVLLKRMVVNLIENAIKYTPAGGLVRVSVESADSAARIVVTDNGAGIPEDALPRVFDRFYRVDKARARATGGSGLGLTIAKQVAEAHGGSISVESKVGAGSTFTVTLPILPPHPNPLPARGEGITAH